MTGHNPRSWLIPGVVWLGLVGFTPAWAQITADGSAGTVVIPGCTALCPITGGTTSGSNLFHSFTEFSLPAAGGRAIFVNNDPAVTTVLGRVTGGLPSLINGALEAGGASPNFDLFLLNPSGITFGSDASLQLNGSFFASTASSVLFADGTQFPTTATPPLLTVSVPAGLQYGATAAPIVVDGMGFTPGLAVPNGRTLALVGGGLQIKAGFMAAPNGRLELGSVAPNQLVNLVRPTPTSWALDYAGIQAYEDITLTEEATASIDGGSIQVRGQNITLSEGSSLGVNPSAIQDGGLLEVIAQETVTLRGTSPAPFFIPGGLFAQTTGNRNAGTISVTAKDVLIEDGAIIYGSTAALGRGGDITLNVTNDVTLRNPPGEFATGIFSQSLAPLAGGNGGNVSITSNTFKLEGEARVSTSTAGNATGGDIRITSPQSIALTAYPNATNTGIDSQSSSPFPTAGTGGNIFLETDNLMIQTFAQVSTGSNAGVAGNIEVTAANATLRDRASISAITNSGLGGAITVQGLSGLLALDTNSQISAATTSGQAGRISITGRLVGGNPVATVSLDGASTISSEAVGNGNAGDIAIQTIATLTVQNNSKITTSVVNGTGGTIAITANDEVDLKAGSTIASQATGTGDAGAVTITTAKLSSGNSTISTSVVDGTGGTIAITANNTVGLNRSTIASEATGTGDAGAVTIATGTLSSDESTVSTSVVDGTGGTIAITANDEVDLKAGSTIASEATGIGDAGAVTITTAKLSSGNSTISTSVVDGTGGTIAITANDEIDLKAGSTIASQATGTGDAGAVTITTAKLSSGNSTISTSVVDGTGGTIAITATNTVELNRSTIASQATGIGDAGAVTITTAKLSSGNSTISTSVVDGTGGTIAITANNTVGLNRSTIASEATGTGDAGAVTIATGTLSSDESTVSTSVVDGIGGTIAITANDEVDLKAGSTIASEATGIGDAGAVTITTAKLSSGNSTISTSVVDGTGGTIAITANDEIDLKAGSTIASQATGTGDAGAVTITTAKLSSGNSTISTSVVDGTGGTIAITATNTVELNRSTIASQATGIGDAGAVTITTAKLSSGNSTISTSVVDGTGGTIAITANNTVGLNRSTIASEATGTGDAGAVTIATGTLSSDESTVSTSVVDGIGGTIAITANDEVDLKAGSTIASEATGIGDAGAVTITTAKLSSDDSTISTSVVDGTGGTIAATANDEVDLKAGSTIASQATGTGDAGAVTITTAKLSSGNSTISTSVVDGTGGTIAATATTAIVLTTNSRFTSEATGNSGTAGTIQMTTPTLQITDSQATVRGLGNSTAGNVQVFANQTTLDGGTVSATTVAGSGGNITLSGQNGQPSTSLTATNTSVISASTQDGQGGSVAVQARQFILLDQDSRLEALASGDQGRPGDVTLTSDRLTIQNNARASVSAVGTQDAGNFTITAAQVQLDNGGQLIAETVAGTGGNIDFQGLQTLTLNNNSTISTSTQDGQGGNLPITATTAISLGNQSQITAEATGRGSGGIVSLAAPGVTLQDGAAITTTAVDGAGGSIRVNAPQSLQLARAARITTEASGNGSAGDIQLLTTAPFTPVDGVQITVSNTGTGNAGNLTIAAPVVKIDRNTQLQAITNSGQGGTVSFPGVTEFTLDNNSVISTETRDGVGGAIVVNAPNQLSLNNGSKITSSATGNGNSGDIRLTTNNPLTIANGSQVTVNSDGTGQGGVIFITANALSMTNNTLIGATTESGKGGNINIQVADSILLRFNSDILTEARGAGDGGNMVLQAGTFIGAILSEDSDIIAGAVTGMGGRIDATALLTFGFRLYSGLNTPESDFTASSQFGINGEVNLNTRTNPAPDPLPDGFAPPSIANTCSVNPAQRSSYRQMGSGGISPLPGNALTPNTVRVNLVSPVPANSAASQALSSQTISPPAVEVTNPAPPLDRIVEAQGWIRLADGTIVLTANPTLLTVYQAGLPILTCGG